MTKYDIRKESRLDFVSSPQATQSIRYQFYSDSEGNTPADIPDIELSFLIYESNKLRPHYNKINPEVEKVKISNPAQGEYILKIEEDYDYIQRPAILWTVLKARQYQDDFIVHAGFWRFSRTTEVSPQSELPLFEVELPFETLYLKVTPFFFDYDNLDFVTIPLESLVFTEYPLLIAATYNVILPLESLTFTEHSLIVTQGQGVQIPLGSLTFTERDLIIVHTESEVIPLESLAFTEYNLTVIQTEFEQIPLESLTFTEYPMDVAQGNEIIIPLESLTFTGYSLIIEHIQIEVIPLGSLTFTERDLIIVHTESEVIPLESLVFTEYNLTVDSSNTAQIPLESLTFSEYDLEFFAIQLSGVPDEEATIQIISSVPGSFRWATLEASQPDLTKGQIANEELNSPPEISGVTLAQSGTVLIENLGTYFDANEDPEGTPVVTLYRNSVADPAGQSTLSRPHEVVNADDAYYMRLGVAPRSTAGKRTGNEVFSEWILIDAAIPAAPSIPTVSDITETSALISWTDNADNETTQYVQWKPQTEPDWAEGTTKAVAAGVESTTITGLTNVTDYDVRVKSANAFGQSAGPAEQFTTATPVTNLHQIESLTADVIDDTIDLNWTETTPIEVENLSIQVIGDTIQLDWNETGYTDMAQAHIYIDGTDIAQQALGINTYTTGSLGEGTHTADVRIISDSDLISGILIDTVPPGLNSATINAAGDQLTLVGDENLNVANLAGITLNGTSAVATSLTSGDGTTTLVIAISPVAQLGETITIDIASGITDDGGNDLIETAYSVTNDSTQTAGFVGTRTFKINYNQYAVNHPGSGWTSLGNESDPSTYVGQLVSTMKDQDNNDVPFTYTRGANWSGRGTGQNIAVDYVDHTGATLSTPAIVTQRNHYRNSSGAQYTETIGGLNPSNKYSFQFIYSSNGTFSTYDQDTKITIGAESIIFDKISNSGTETYIDSIEDVSPDGSGDIDIIFEVAGPSGNRQFSIAAIIMIEKVPG